METTLMTKTFILLAGCLACGGLGAYLGRNIRSIGTMIGLAIAFILGVFVVFAAAKASPVLGILSLAGWTLVSGLFSAPSLRHYKERLGWETVASIFAGSSGVMMICAAIGVFSGIDFSFMGNFLFFALTALVLFGLVSLFIRFSRKIQMIEAVVGMLLFSAYFIYDFFRVTRETNTWEHAIQSAMAIYLDLINFFFDALRFYDLYMNK